MKKVSMSFTLANFGYMVGLLGSLIAALIINAQIINGGCTSINTKDIFMVIIGTSVLYAIKETDKLSIKRINEENKE